MDIDASAAGTQHIGVRPPRISFALAWLWGAVSCCSLIAQPVQAAIGVEHHAAPAIPLAGWVTDNAHILSAAERATLTSKLIAFERATRRQLVVVTTASLGGRDIGNYARDLGNSWGIGRKGYNDGVMLVVAPNEHKVRIAVGYGLEKTLSNQDCQRIIVENILPYFRRGELAAGIDAGTDAIISRLR